MKRCSVLWFLLFVMSWGMCSCGGGKAVRTSAPVPTDPAGVIATALSQLGRPYKYGGTSPETGFDCSGFTCWVYAQHHIQLPRQSNDQFSVGHRVYIGQLLPGDLIFFDVYEKGASHVGIYIGRSLFIHSSSTGGSVREERLSDRYWKKCYLGARRIITWDR